MILLDLIVCLVCQGQRRNLAVIIDLPAIRYFFLEHLGLPTKARSIAATRFPPGSGDDQSI